MPEKNVIQTPPLNEKTKHAPQYDRSPITSHELIGSNDFLEILHEGSIYRLRITKLKKLILTK